MSVLIKDMEKPKSCYAVIDGESEFCPFVNTDDDCVLQLKKGICEGTWADQYSKCPLAEEPERKKGRWILTQDEDYEYCTCSECGYQNGENWMNGANIPFCAMCGSYNGGEQDEND